MHDNVYDALLLSLECICMYTSMCIGMASACACAWKRACVCERVPDEAPALAPSRASHQTPLPPHSSRGGRGRGASLASAKLV